MKLVIVFTILKNYNTQFLLIGIFIMKMGLRMKSFILFFLLVFLLSKLETFINYIIDIIHVSYNDIYTVIKPFHIFFHKCWKSDKYAIQNQTRHSDFTETFMNVKV